MLNKIASFLTKENIEVLYKVAVKIAEALKSYTTDWKKKSTLSIVISVAAIALFVALIVYFIVTRHITPLLIYLVCMTPILAFGLAQYSRNMVSLSKEYEEYRTAIRILLQKIMEVANVDESDAVISVGAVLGAIQKADGTLIDDTTTLSEIKGLPDYPIACYYAELMEAVGLALDALKIEGVDVAELLEQFEVSELEKSDALLGTLYGNNPMNPDDDTTSNT